MCLGSEYISLQSIKLFFNSESEVKYNKYHFKLIIAVTTKKVFKLLKAQNQGCLVTYLRK